jgi:hypothetical protein
MTTRLPLTALEDDTVEAGIISFSLPPQNLTQCTERVTTPSLTAFEDDAVECVIISLQHATKDEARPINHNHDPT